jgi:hypothetical protein
MRCLTKNQLPDRRINMPSKKQLQSRLQNKKNSLNTVNLKFAQASNSKNNIILRRLKQEKDSLGRDIRNLERQLVTMENDARRRSVYN